ncbi:flagellum-specific ATP synthase [Escherichia coli]|nr:flagellum-specific ATP synthase [Escherichia coli]
MKKLKLLNKYSYLHSINGSLIEAELTTFLWVKYAKFMRAGKQMNV